MRVSWCFAPVWGQIRTSPNKQCLFLFLGTGSSTVVEHTPHNQEVVVSHSTGIFSPCFLFPCWKFQGVDIECQTKKMLVFPDSITFLMRYLAKECLGVQFRARSQCARWVSSCWGWRGFLRHCWAGHWTATRPGTAWRPLSSAAAGWWRPLHSETRFWSRLITAEHQMWPQWKNLNIFIF